MQVKPREEDVAMAMEKERREKREEKREEKVERREEKVENVIRLAERAMHGAEHASASNDHLSNMMGDAPFCDSCGHMTVRNGSCYRCLNCGNSMGCS